MIMIDMEMPTCCAQCPLHDEDYRGIEHCDIGWKKIGKAEEKPSWCPLAPVPPHGALIDRDALEAVVEQHYKHLKISRYDRDLLLHYLDIEMSPTIIPAEPREKKA